MSREIRRVPPDWRHPMEMRNGRTGYKPLFEFESYADALEEYQKYPDEYEDRPPKLEDYMPDFGDTATCWQVYETVTEGTPISPVFVSEEALFNWLTTDGAGLGIGGRRMPLTPDQARRFMETKFSVSMVAGPGDEPLRSGLQS